MCPCQAWFTIFRVLNTYALAQNHSQDHGSETQSHLPTQHRAPQESARASERRQACEMNWKLHFGVHCSRLKICYCRQVEPVKPKRAYHQPSRELRIWVVDYALLNKEGREPRDVCDVLIPILREKCDHVGEDAMTHRFGTRWIRRRSKMDGVRFIGTTSTVVTTTGTTMAGGRHVTMSTGPARTREDFLQHISLQQPVKQAMQFFAESVCRDEVVLDLRLSTTKRLMGSACLRRGGKARASQRKLGATSTSTSHSSMRRRWIKKSDRRNGSPSPR